MEATVELRAAGKDCDKHRPAFAAARTSIRPASTFFAVPIIAVPTFAATMFAEPTFAAPRFTVQPHRWPAAKLSLHWMLAIGIAIGLIAGPNVQAQMIETQVSGSHSNAPPNAAPLKELIAVGEIRASGDHIYRWPIDDGEASLLQGDCVLQVDGRQIAAESVLLVVDGPPQKVRTRVVIDQWIDQEGRRRTEPASLQFRSPGDPQVQSPDYRGQPAHPVDLMRYINGPPQSDIEQVQFQQPLSAGPTEFSDTFSSSDPIAFTDGASADGYNFYVGGGSRSIEIRSRNASTPPIIETDNRHGTGETVITARGGVTILIRDVTAQLPSGELMQLGTISLSADRVVSWLPLMTDLFSGESDLSQSEGELYLEGDIVFRQGERIIYADSMYYNVTRETGMVLDAEAITTVPEYQGIVRLKADVMQQVSRGNFIAFDAAVTSSRMGVPRYWLQSEQLQMTDQQRPVADPITGRPTIDSEPFASSNNNFVYFGGVPLLYWPRFSTSLEQPTFYINDVRIKSDKTFGTQLYLDWNLFQLLGIVNPPPGVDWELSTDYLSDRGPAVGTTIDYNVPGFMGVPGPAKGNFDAWIIDDSGTDRLGRDRLNLTPEETIRGRTLWRHRQYLANNYEFIAELGWLSDRNFLEQYLENEWDNSQDHNTGLRLRRYAGANMLELSANVQVNDFYGETEQLPSLDHYLLGGSILGDRVTWSAHNRVGYSRMNVADDPIDAVEAAEYDPLPGEFDRRGIVASTRQELALPVQTGPVKIVPFVSGEAAHYGEAVDGDSLTRLLGQAGVRASLPMWRVDPTIQSSLMNIRGLAHKMEWTAEYFYADSDTNFDELPLYDSLDDNAQEQFRRRFISDIFGGVLPDEFDPRTYAIRNGIQRSVVSGSDVLADDLQQFRLGLHQRWQTKRGLPGRERIVDLFQFDIDTILFPNADEENFGETLGPTTYDMRYHIGDRFSILSDGYYDAFDDGLRTISAGFVTSRPGKGDIYLGLLSIEGPISSTVLRSTIDYRMNEKWIMSAGTTYDFGRTGNVGQSLALTRIGESMLIRLGVNVDEGRDNVGFGFSIEPRFWPKPRLGRIGGQLIPPPGVEGLE
tara:strand:- start:973153 stop:976428 length:3276 start_codon:yes stop_codon:yes gene_type:complete